MGKVNVEEFNDRQKDLLEKCKSFWRSPAGTEAIKNTTTWEERNEGLVDGK